MIDTQLGRRNLTPIQRIAITEKYRDIIKEEAKKNQGTRTDLTSSRNLQEVKSVHTRDELAKKAGVSHDTYSKEKRILDSDNKIGLL